MNKALKRDANTARWL